MLDEELIRLLGLNPSVNISSKLLSLHLLPLGNIVLDDLEGKIDLLLVVLVILAQYVQADHETLLHCFEGVGFVVLPLLVRRVGRDFELFITLLLLSLFLSLLLFKPLFLLLLLSLNFGLHFFDILDGKIQGLREEARLVRHADTQERA